MKSGEHFDVIIIGAGPSGIFCAYELIKEKPELNILMIEKGRPIEKRVCPKRKTKVCVAANHVPSPPVSPEQELSPTASSPFPRMSAEICRRS